MLTIVVWMTSFALLTFPLTAQGETPINSSVIGFPLPDRVPITIENADQVVELARIGSGMIDDYAWTPDGTLLFIATSLGVWVYDTRTPEEHATLLPVQFPVTSAAASDLVIAGGDEAGNIHLWDRETLEPVGTLTNHLYAVRGIGFNADGSLLASADQSGVARLWDVASMTEQAVTSLPDAYFDSIAFDAADLLYIQDRASADQYIDFDLFSYNLIWNVDENTLEHLSQTVRIPDPFRARIGVDTFSLVYSEDNRTFYEIFDIAFYVRPEIVIFTEDGNALDMWRQIESDFGFELLPSLSLIDGQIQSERGGSTLPMAHSPLSPDGKYGAYGSDSSRITVRQFFEQSDAQPTYLYGHMRGISALFFSPTDPRLLVSGSLDMTLRLWDVTAPPDTPSLTVLEGHQSGVTSADINAAGDLIASVSYDGTIRLWGIPQTES